MIAIVTTVIYYQLDSYNKYLKKKNRTFTKSEKKKIAVEVMIIVLIVLMISI